MPFAHSLCPKGIPYPEGICIIQSRVYLVPRGCAERATGSTRPPFITLRELNPRFEILSGNFERHWG